MARHGTTPTSPERAHNHPRRPRSSSPPLRITAPPSTCSAALLSRPRWATTQRRRATSYRTRKPQRCFWRSSPPSRRRIRRQAGAQRRPVLPERWLRAGVLRPWLRSSGCPMLSIRDPSQRFSPGCLSAGRLLSALTTTARSRRSSPTPQQRGCLRESAGCCRSSPTATRSQLSPAARLRSYATGCESRGCISQARTVSTSRDPTARGSTIPSLRNCCRRSATQ
mmetsp:Transcript_38906/g.90994  ORF Transcript_38906/g.90994 Transcript_38906/m.90994 type:complete len:224 (+) Transcript_38906:910-1581(+)